MGLLSIFKRGATPAVGADAAVDAGGPVQRARTRARQRLIGAVVLVGLGVIGFPLVFETQPRPIPVDIPIELPRRDNAPPLAMPPARLPPTQATAPSSPAATRLAETPASAPTDVITESHEDAGRELSTVPAAASGVDARPVAAASAPSVAKMPVAAPANDGARAQALLDGKPSTPAGDGRFVVQVGAFADAGAARETRARVEKLGLKTYTQIVNTPAGSRIRVRAGPFASRDEADKALAKARSVGLAAAVLTL